MAVNDHLDWLDANVVLRFLLGDHPEQSPRAAALISRAETGEMTLAVSQHIICEVVYVLEGQGHDRKGICSALTRFASIRGVSIEGAEAIITALLHYRDAGIDFADALLYSKAALRGERLWTFNKKHFRRLGAGWQEP